jgi:ATP/maltotriose-dependent transcriptional regulator MalT
MVAGLVPFFLNRGRPGEASRLLATAERGFGTGADVGVLEFRIYAALHWDGDTSEGAAAARALESYLAGAPTPARHVRDPRTASCALAHWRLAAGDMAGAEAALGRIRRLDAAAPSPLIESTRVCAVTIEAQLAAARHRPEAAAVLERLDTLLRAGSDPRHLVPFLANLIAARLYEERGDLQRALGFARRRNLFAAGANLLLSRQLREEGRLAALVGDHAGAVRAYRHYLALRSDPEPTLRSQGERVRAELERLEEGAGRN